MVKIVVRSSILGGFYMSAKGFRNLLNHISNLESYRKERVYWQLKNELYPSTLTGRVIDELRERKFNEGLVCPRCNSKGVIRYDKYDNKQRYKCKDCTRTFTDFTNTPLHYTHKPQLWISFIECMIEGKSLRDAQDILGITWVTLFYWRHKLLKALSHISVEQFEGILEVDETYFLYSEKGNKTITSRKPRKRGGVSSYRGISKEQVCVLVARDRSKKTVSKVTCMGRIVKSKLDDTIGDKICANNILCTDAWRAYKTYATDKGLEHYRIDTKKTGHTIKGIYHIQNVNSYHGRMKHWLDRFKGVATKYLNNYLSWFRFLESNEFEGNSRVIKNMLVTSCLYPTTDTFKSLREEKFEL
jgi:transposase-like protein/IS1 family transposase